MILNISRIQEEKNQLEEVKVLFHELTIQYVIKLNIHYLEGIRECKRGAHIYVAIQNIVTLLVCEWAWENLCDIFE